jgi:hypothetical protein
MAPYLYKPLQSAIQEIRLVHLLPGRFEDEIKFRVVHSPLPLPEIPRPKTRNIDIESIRSLFVFPWTIEELECGDVILFNVGTGETRPFDTVIVSQEEALEYRPQYEALSYTWGDADISEPGHVEDCLESSEPPATLGLRPNLAFALRSLRYSDKVRILWIDAICINQQDIEERNEQVKRMTNIYILAQRVVAWLGEESNDSKHALTALRHVGRQLEVTKSGRIIAAHNATESELWRNDHKPSFDQRTWQALMNFMERAWFYRVWCWQEIKLGSAQAVLQCGRDKIAWNKFWLAVLCLHNKNELPSMLFRERCRHIAYLKYSLAGQPMSNILDISRSKGCSNPRDKIYGLLGITPSYFSSGIVVDYSQPVQDVYKEAFLTHLNTTKRLELLKHCNLESRKIGGPSWVPDWSRTEFGAPILSEQLSSGTSKAWYTYVKPDVLEVVGKMYTTITSISKVASKVEEQTLLVVRDWFQHLPNNGTYITGETMETAFALTLCMDRTRERHPYQNFLSSTEWVGMLRRFLCLTATSQNDMLYSVRETGNTIQKIRGRRFFTTSTGHMGTAPAGTKVGESGNWHQPYEDLKTDCYKVIQFVLF